MIKGQGPSITSDEKSVDWPGNCTQTKGIYDIIIINNVEIKTA